MIIEKKWGRFKKLMEAMHTFGIELIDTNFTTIKGAHLVTTFMQPGIETPHLSEQHSSNPYPRAPSGSTASSSP
ncbi:hypothetical protein JHK82_020597 [Glycine max]|nr:hypothetical protein JHK87_020500 [Glycine soja]KAG5024696.1 hypothetical protein JHK86_020610 [Glycine max]KAG5135866.1 hypothetical protein JHK82_020597 [Glycine max]